MSGGGARVAGRVWRARSAVGRGPEPGLSRPCPSDSSMEALTLNLTEVVKRQNPKSKKGFNQVRTPPHPPLAAAVPSEDPGAGGCGVGTRSGVLCADVSHPGALGLPLGALVSFQLGEGQGRRRGKAEGRLTDPGPSWLSAPQSRCGGGRKERAALSWPFWNRDRELMGALLPDQHVTDQSGQGADHRLQLLPLRRVPGPG